MNKDNFWSQVFEKKNHRNFDIFSYKKIQRSSILVHIWNQIANFEAKIND